MLIPILFSLAGLDDRGLEGQQMSGGLYGHRSNSSASSSPPATSGSGQTGLVVPQPVKGGQGQGNGNGSSGHIHSHPSNGSSGRKYQCKMCPQVGKVSWIWIFRQIEFKVRMRSMLLIGKILRGPNQQLVHDLPSQWAF